MSQYPQSIAELIDQNRRYKPDVLRAAKALARSKPWRNATAAEKEQKYRAANKALAAAYGIPEPTLVFQTDEAQDSGASCYIPSTNTIILRGRMSVVSFLHEWGHRLGKDEKRACSWSINLFRRCFPKSWAHVKFDRHMVRRGTEGPRE